MPTNPQPQQQSGGNLGQKDAQQERDSKQAMGKMGERTHEGEKQKPNK